MVKKLFVLVFLLLSACVSGTPGDTPADGAQAPMQRAPEVNAPEWKVGDEWQYSDGYGLRVSNVEGDLTTFERTDVFQNWREAFKQQSRWIKRRGFFKVESHDGTVHRQIIFRSQSPDPIFPLQVGKRVSFVREYLADDNLREHISSWEVVGKDVIEVPAGRFNCWVLMWRTQSTKSDWTGWERWWYSPEVRHYVRMEYKYGLAAQSSRVLSSYKLGH